MQAPRIYDYAIIGDSRSAALVSREGSIDWLCWPRFDSPSLFAALLDPEAGGHFRIAPAVAGRSARAYLDDSNVLATTFENPEGTFRLVDFMPAFSEDHKRRALVPEHEIVRIVEGIAGEALVELSFQPRPDYARRNLRLRDARALGVRMERGAEITTLRADVPLEIREPSTVTARFRVRACSRGR